MCVFDADLAVSLPQDEVSQGPSSGDAQTPRGRWPGLQGAGRLSSLWVCLPSAPRPGSPALAFRPRVREAVPARLSLRPVLPRGVPRSTAGPSAGPHGLVGMHEERHLPVWPCSGPASLPGHMREPVAWLPLVRGLVHRGAHNTPGHPRRACAWGARHSTSIWAVCLA